MLSYLLTDALGPHGLITGVDEKLRKIRKALFNAALLTFQHMSKNEKKITAHFSF